MPRIFGDWWNKNYSDLSEEIRLIVFDVWLSSKEETRKLLEKTIIIEKKNES